MAPEGGDRSLRGCLPRAPSFRALGRPATFASPRPPLSTLAPGLGALVNRPFLSRPLCQFDDRLWCRIASAGTEAYDPGVAARTVCESGRELVEESPYDARFLDEGQGAPTSMKATALAQGDHPIREPAHLFGLRARSLDGLVLQERRHEVPEQRPTVRGGPVEFSSGPAVLHP